MDLKIFGIQEIKEPLLASLAVWFWVLTLGPLWRLDVA